MNPTKSPSKFPSLLLAPIAALAIMSSVAPVHAQSTAPNPSDVAATVSTVGTVAGGAVAIVLGAMGVRLAIKMVNRLTVKG